MVREGKDFAQNQLAQGIQLFREILGANVSVEFELGDESDVDSERGDVGADEFSNSFGLDYEGLKAIALDVAPSFSSVGERSKLCCTYYLPSHLSQGTINGRNGSNACILISLLSGYFLARMDGSDLTDILKVLIGAMEIGNALYEEHGCNDMLNVHEGIALLPEEILLRCVEESGCIIKEHISIPLDFDVPTFFILVAEGKAYSFLVKTEFVILTDSHAHPPHGACIKVIQKSKFDMFVRSVFNDIYLNIAVCDYL